MAKGRELKGRIKSVENTRKITRTMEMVATSKMKRAMDRVIAARPYAQALGDVMSRLYSPELAERFPLLRQPAPTRLAAPLPPLLQRAQPRRAAVILITGNRGLSGAFNANLIRESRNLIARLEREGVEVELHAVGRKGLGYYRYIGRPVASSRIDIGDRPTAANAAEIVDGVMEAFASRRLDAVYIVHAHFRSAISTPPTTEKILPVTPPGEDQGKQQDYLLFPSAEEILSSLLPSYVRNMVYRALVENTAAFYSAQRTAMKNATDNATDMLNILRRTYNRARQANITQEIAEIVGGASALQG